MKPDLQGRSILRWTAIGVGVPALLVASAAAGSSADQTATTSPARNLYHPIAVGLPEVGPGVLDHFLTGGGIQVLSESAVGLDDSGSLGRFGAAVGVVNLDQDRFSDLVVGAPGNVAERVPGRVDLLFGTATGITAARARTLPSPGATGDEFGAAIALGTPNPYDTEGDRTLWVGAPGTTVGGKAGAGAVYRYSLSPTGELTLLDTITQDSPLVPGVSEAGDRFGAILSSSGNDVTVGVPNEDIGTAADAGAVQRLRAAVPVPDRPARSTPLVAALSWNQNSPGVPGVAEAGDRFGAAVTGSGTVVGVPGEDLGAVKDAGMVQTFAPPPGHSGQLVELVAGPARNQNSPGVPGVAEAGDQFGAALTQGWYICDEIDRTAVGAPGEDLGRTKDAGSVTLLGLRGCPVTVLTQGSGLPGRAEAGDRVGATLETVTGDFDLENNRQDALLIAVPGEDITTGGTRPQTYRDTGRVVVWGSDPIGFGAQLGDRAGQRYGTVLGSELR